MKAILEWIFICGVIGAGPVWAQGPWVGGPSGPIYYNGGNVGIGTASPSQLLFMSGSGFTPQFTIENSQDYPVYINFVTSQGSSSIGPGIYSGPGFTDNFQITSSGGIMLNPGSSGNVGIWTPNPQYALSVRGTVQAYEVLVEAGWSDYVFNPDYALRSLKDVAAYVKQNHHLPDIPSEAEVKEKGVRLGDMESKLLAKVEELTLHMIAADERISQLEKQNRYLENKLKQSTAVARAER